MGSAHLLHGAARAEAPAAEAAVWWAALRVAAPLLGILLACIAFRLLLATGESRLVAPLPEELLAQPWKLLAPYDFGGGRMRWTPTGYVLLGLMNLVVPAPLMFVLLLAILVVTSYSLSYMALRSRVFSSTLAICMGFGTQFNYAYVHNGGNLWVLFALYVVINLFFLHAVATQAPEARWPRVGFAISLICFALCWEQWLDYLAFLLTVISFAYVMCRRHAAYRQRFWPRIRWLAVATGLIAISYLVVRIPYSGEHFTAGHESDTIFTYSTPIMSVDDWISNLFTYPYIALTNFCPSWFNGSNSLYHVGEQRILAEQNGYHPDKLHLVGMHHLFFWHYYAGAILCALVLYGVRTVRQAWTAPSASVLLVIAMLALVCTGFATHTIIKFRPYMSVPLLSYKCIISVVGAALLMSLAAMRLTERCRLRSSRMLVACSLWLALLVTSIERFSYHSKMSQHVGLGAFPRPVATAKSTLRGWLHPKPAALSGQPQDLLATTTAPQN